MDLSRFKRGTRWSFRNVRGDDDEVTLVSSPVRLLGVWRVWARGFLEDEVRPYLVSDLDPPQHRHPRMSMGFSRLTLDDKNYSSQKLHRKVDVRTSFVAIGRTYCAKKAIPGTLEAEMG